MELKEKIRLNRRLGNGDCKTYDDIIKCIDELVDYLKDNEIYPNLRSHFEDDYLKAHQFYENFKKSPYGKQDEEALSAFTGLYELYKWIWSVKDCGEFPKLRKHLKLLIDASPRINSCVPYISPVTEKPDDKTNKFFEAIIGMWAVKVGKNVELDDPVKSSSGNNPDVMFEHSGKLIAIACKTLRSKFERTVFDKFQSAAKQIERAKCDMGYIAINAMNILPHKKIRDKIFNDFMEPIDILSDDITRLYREIRKNTENEILDIFRCTKVRPVVLTFIHSITKLDGPFGSISISLKSTFATDFEIPGYDVSSDIKLLELVNEFIHNRL